MIFNNIKNDENNIEFKNIIKDIYQNKYVREMYKYNQHAGTSCFEHCLQVSYYTYLICKKLNLDYVSAARGAMLHDFFLYNWRHSSKGKKFRELHAFSHPQIALENASKYFILNDIEKDVIKKHMWPVTIALPKYKESYIITITDKYSAIVETFRYLNYKYHLKTIYRYAYVFLTLLFVQI